MGFHLEQCDECGEFDGRHRAPERKVTPACSRWEDPETGPSQEDMDRAKIFLDAQPADFGDGRRSNDIRDIRSIARLIFDIRRRNRGRTSD